MHPEGYQCFIAGCRTKYVRSTCGSVRSELTPTGPNRIKRRSAFFKHVKAKHNIDLNKMSPEEVAAAADLTRVSPDAERIATPPPDYTTATKEPMYNEEDLPIFSPDLMPKEEVHTPPQVVTPPPAVIDVIPSSEGYKWSSAGFVGSCFHLRVVPSVLLLTGQIMYRPHGTRDWRCLWFSRFDVTSRTAAPHSSPST